MFMGPLEAVKPWSTRSIEGIDRFLGRVWRLGELIREQGAGPPRPERSAGRGSREQEKTSVSDELERKRHETIKRVTEDLEGLRFNTAISAMMEFVNAMYALPASREAFQTLVLLLSPFAPHLGEELWQGLGYTKSVAYEPWPSYDPKALAASEILWVIQVNGKVRAKITLPAELNEEQVKARVLADGQVRRHVDGRAIKQTIVVPKRLVNLVV
jgi:leucyl-tRNA synthetase